MSFSPPVYLDHAATTPMRPEAVQAMLPFLTEKHGNAGSLHRFGREAREAVERARDQVAAFLGVDSREIIFTSGGTEANHLALRGGWDGGHRRGAVVSSNAEHSSVSKTLDSLAESSGCGRRILPVDRTGRVDLDAARDRIDEACGIVSVVGVNSDIGTRQPIAKIGDLCRRRGVPFHCDGVQWAPWQSLQARDLPVDLLSVSAHKLGGPKGVGALVCRRGVSLSALQLGGLQERGARAGTENVAGIVAFGCACALAGDAMDAEARNVERARLLLEESVLGRVDGSWLNGAGAPRSAHIANFGFAGVEGGAVAGALDARGVAVSTGSACRSGEPEPSPTLMAMGASRGEALSAVRVSLGRGDAGLDWERVVSVLKDVVTELRDRPRAFYGT